MRISGSRGDVFSSQQHPAPYRGGEADDQTDCCRFANSVTAQQRDRLAFPYGKGDALQDVAVTIIGVDVFKGKRGMMLVFFSTWSGTSIKHNHAANILACQHVIVSLIDLIEGVGACHQLIKLELTMPVHIQQFWYLH